jgi:phosphate starvation-inducible membrane PsiE
MGRVALLEGPLMDFGGVLVLAALYTATVMAGALTVVVASDVPHALLGIIVCLFLFFAFGIGSIDLTVLDL